MKTSLKKLRGLSLHNKHHQIKDLPIHLQPLSQSDELAHAPQDLQDMRDCYDSLLSAAAATANSAYEFSESLRELGACLLKKTALNENEDGGKVMLTLGKLQYELHKSVDKYRSHMFQTIAVPSESLLNELQTVEEMKNQCDEKRDAYENMLKKQKEKGRLKGGKVEAVSVQQIQLARDEYDEAAAQFTLRMKSLKQGQSRCLLTQAARHHAAQLFFFKKALSSVEAVEPHVKLVTEQQHIDYKFNGIDDEGDLDNDDDDEDNDDDDDEDNDDDDDDDDRELSFEYENNEREPDVSTTRSSMESDQVDVTFPKISSVEALKERLRRNSFSFKGRAISQSAPLFPDNNLDRAERLRHLQPSISRKFHSYVLPTPGDTNHSASTGPGNTIPETVQTRLTGQMQNLWHSSPLEPNNEKIMGDKKPAGATVINVQSVLKESNNNSASHRLPPPLADRKLSTGPMTAFDSKDLKRHAFSGPLLSKLSSSKPVSVGSHQMYSGPLLRSSTSQAPSVSPPKVSPNASPTFLSSPKINELHELPRPPFGLTSKSSRPQVGHSAPLLPGAQMQSTTSKLPLLPTPSPLPTPPQIIPRSLSIPSRSPRVTELDVSKSYEAFRVSEESEGAASPALNPMALSNSPKKS